MDSSILTNSGCICHSSSDVSLNHNLLAGPTVLPLIDISLRFRLHHIAVITDISTMYQAVKLMETDRDFQRFGWRTTPSEILQDYRMTRVRFGVSVSSFMPKYVKQNVTDLAHTYPRAAKVVDNYFYVDDGLTGADSTQEATELQKTVSGAFTRRYCFLLRKWNSSDPTVLQHIAPQLQDSQTLQTITDVETYIKTLRNKVECLLGPLPTH